MIKSVSKHPKQPAKNSQLSSSEDEPNVEITEVDDLHSSTSSYVLNPKLKASAISMPTVE